MQTKNISGIIHIQNGMCFSSKECTGTGIDPKEMGKTLNNSCLDRVIVFEHSTNDNEHDNNILAIKDLARVLEISLCAGGTINRLEDVKKLLYAGAVEVIIDGSNDEAINLCTEASSRFGADKVIVALHNIDFVFKIKGIEDAIRKEYIVMDESLYAGILDETKVPCILYTNEKDAKIISEHISHEKSSGFAGEAYVASDFDVMALKNAINKPPYRFGYCLGHYGFSESLG